MDRVGHGRPTRIRARNVVVEVRGGRVVRLPVLPRVGKEGDVSLFDGVAGVAGVLGMHASLRIEQDPQAARDPGPAGVRGPAQLAGGRACEAERAGGGHVRVHAVVDAFGVLVRRDDVADAVGAIRVPRRPVRVVVGDAPEHRPAPGRQPVPVAGRQPELVHRERDVRVDVDLELPGLGERRRLLAAAQRTLPRVPGPAHSRSSSRWHGPPGGGRSGIAGSPGRWSARWPAARGTSTSRSPRRRARCIRRRRGHPARVPTGCRCGRWPAGRRTTPAPGAAAVRRPRPGCRSATVVPTLRPRRASGRRTHAPRRPARRSSPDGAGVRSPSRWPPRRTW